MAPTAMAATAPAVASCFHPKVEAGRSSSNAAMPRPMAMEIAATAGASRTAGSMDKLPVHPRR